MKQQQIEYGINFKIFVIKCDNTSAINLDKNLVLHSWTKHIKIKDKFVRDCVEKKNCVIEFVNSSNQLEDIFFTKRLH